MTAKHFQLIADALVAQRDIINSEAYVMLVADFANRLEQENPRFNSNRFFEACGI